MARVRVRFGASVQKPTWAILPSEREKKPGIVTVTNAAGRVIATIDPITRIRRNRHGQKQAVLSQQGWGLDGRDLQKITFDRTAPWGIVPLVPRVKTR